MKKFDLVGIKIEKTCQDTSFNFRSTRYGGYLKILGKGLAIVRQD